MTDDCRSEALLFVEQQSRERLRLAAVSMANSRHNVLQWPTHLEERRELSDDPISETSSLSGATKMLQSKHISRKSEFSHRGRKHWIKKKKKGERITECPDCSGWFSCQDEEKKELCASETIASALADVFTTPYVCIGTRVVAGVQ